MIHEAGTIPALPEVPVVDIESGLTVNYPLGLQVVWELSGETMERIRALRAELGITIDDQFEMVRADPEPGMKSYRMHHVPPMEFKVRHVRTPEGARYYGLPIGSPITAGAIAKARKKKGKKAPTKKPSRAKTPSKTTGKSKAQGSVGTKPGTKTPDKPASAAQKQRAATSPVARRAQQAQETAKARKVQESMAVTTAKGTKKPTRTDTAQRAERIYKDQTSSHMRRNVRYPEAWPGEDAMQARRANVAKREYNIEYASKAEVDKARRIAIERAKLTPKPEKHVIADNKLIIKNGGPGSKNAAGKSQLDNLRGNIYQRSANSWATYVAFGGINARGVDKGYVPCVGCGMKMSWHDEASMTAFAKFEQDKIITTGDGGSYIPQNLVPQCAGCNNKRGNKKLWDVPAFKGAKPKWFTPAFEAEVKKTRAKKSTSTQKRPKKEIPSIPMPVPPGKVKPPAESRRTVKSLMFDAAMLSLKMQDEEYQMTGEAEEHAQELLDQMSSEHEGPLDNIEEGDIVWGYALNHDGSIAHMEPVDQELADERITGRYFSEDIDSAWGRYTRHAIIKDDGISFDCDPSTIVKVGVGQQKSEYSDDMEFTKHDYITAAILEIKDVGSSDPRAARLRRWWVSGPGRARWNPGTPGSYRRLRAQLAKHVGARASGLAAIYYRAATGRWPGRRGKKK